MRMRRRISVRVLEGLEAGRHGRPLVVPEVRVMRAGRDDQRVVLDRAAVRQDDPPALDVDVDRLAEDHRRVALLAQHGAQRLRDLARRQRAGRDLVEHRLEQVEVAPVDERDRDLRVVAEAPRRVQPAEPAADDHDAVARPLALPVRGRSRLRARVRTAGVDRLRVHGRGYLSRSAALLSAACAAASRATGTRNGEHDT